jgi:type I restriction enzyme S subunit
MSEWKKSILGDIAEIIMGQSPKGETCNNNGIGFPLLNGPTEFTTSYPVPTQYTTDPKRFSEINDLLFCVRGSTTGKMNWSDQRYAIGRGIGAIRHRNGAILNPYIKGIIEYHLPIVLQSATGSTFPNVSREQLSSLKIIVPDLPTQIAIAEILSSLDEKIELNNKINQELETLAQTLFKQWFIDFEFPNENGEPYKSSGGEIVESELGEIPKGWEVKTLADISNITIGRTPPRQEHQWFSTDFNDYKWISIRDMGNCGTYILSTSECLTEEAVIKFNVPVIDTNTVILSFKLTVGRVSITTEKMLSNEAIAHLNLKETVVFPEFLYLYLKQFNFDTLGSTSSIATAVNSKSIKSIPLITPNKEVLIRFKELVLSIFSRINNLTFENRDLTNLRDTILPKLISGELEINEISN